MKILFLSKYPRLGASSRLRTFQYQARWEEAGYEVTIDSFFNDPYLEDVYSHHRPNIWNVLGCYLRRFFLLFTLHRYDIIWIEKEIFPFLPAFAERLIDKFGKGYIVDYDDAVFHNYDRSKRSIIRKGMGNKIDQVMKYSKLTLVGNAYIEDRARTAGAKEILRLPTVIDRKRYHLKDYEDNHPVTIGWIGSPTTLKYLKTLLPVLEELHTKIPFTLLVANGKHKVDFSGDLLSLPWTEATEVDIIHQMDIGIMPLPDDFWERGKCSYKLIQYMACGLPVVASPVGMNTEVVMHGENGYLAKTREEWKKYLSELIFDPEKRKTMGDTGYRLVHEKYTLEANFPIMLQTVENILAIRPKRKVHWKMFF